MRSSRNLTFCNDVTILGMQRTSRKSCARAGNHGWRRSTPGLLRQVGGFPEGSPERFPEGSPEGSPEATHPHLPKTLWLTLTQSAAAVCAPLSRSSRLVSPDPLGRSPHYPMVSITGSLRIPLDPYGALCDRGCPKGVSKGGTKGKLLSPKGKLPSP